MFSAHTNGRRSLSAGSRDNGKDGGKEKEKDRESVLAKENAVIIFDPVELIRYEVVTYIPPFIRSVTPSQSGSQYIPQTN